MKKKNFKLISTGLLCICLVGTFTSCGQKDPYTVYSEASKKISDLKSIEATTEMKILLSGQGQEMEIPMTSDMKMENIQAEDMKLSMHTTMEILEQNTEMNTYYTDGYYYLDSAGNKVKYTMDLSEIQEQVASSTMQTTDLKKEDFKEITMKKDGDQQLITYTIDGDSMTEIADSAFGALSGLFAGTDLNMDIQDITGTMTVSKDGYASSYSMKMPFSMEIEDQKMSINMDIQVTYLNPGKEVTVELPDDLDTYEEMDLIGGADGPADITIEDSTGGTDEK